jgi:hypothetical protein
MEGKQTLRGVQVAHRGMNSAVCGRTPTHGPHLQIGRLLIQRGADVRGLLHPLCA